MQCNVVQCCTMQCSIVRSSAVQWRAFSEVHASQPNAVQCSAVQCILVQLINLQCKISAIECRVVQSSTHRPCFQWTQDCLMSNKTWANPCKRCNNPISLISPIGHDLESENISPIPNWIKYHQLGVWNNQLGILYPMGDFLLIVL